MIPISSLSRRLAASIIFSPGRGWLQQVLVHNPPQWYFVLALLCSNNSFLELNMKMEKAR